MWNKLLEILQEPALKRLGLAIVISAVLHSIFFGNIHFPLPSFKPDVHLIEARILTPKAVLTTATESEPTTQAEPIAEPLPEILAELPPEAIAPVTENKAEEMVALEASPIILPDEASALVPPIDNVDPIPVQEPAEQEDIGLIINENAYQYLETEFDVRTAIDGSAEGKATITYDVIENMQYRISWLTEGAGIMALLFPALLQTSDGELTKTGLRPSHYLYQFGKKADKTRAASFDWQAKKVILQTAKATKTEDLPEGTQDLLSFMYQFMHVPPLQHMQMPIVNGKKLRIYDYSFEGEEQINSSLGELKTIHILHSGSNEEEKTELWLAIDYQYVPVKIRKIESDGSVVEMLATRITTNRTVANE